MLARAQPDDEFERKLAAITRNEIAKGNGVVIEQALYGLDKESAGSVLDRAFVLGNLGAGVILTTIVLGGGALHGYVPIEGFAITAVHAPGVMLATLENRWAREIGRGLLLIGTGIGIVLL